jgi:hypothetical protein
MKFKINIHCRQALTIQMYSEAMLLNILNKSRIKIKQIRFNLKKR